MSEAKARIAVDHAVLDDMALVTLALQGDGAAFRHIMQRCNQRLFRLARSILNDDAEAEDVVQEAYAHAFEKLDTFRGEASLMTWLSRIVINEAHGRIRQRRPTVGVEHLETPSFQSAQIMPFPSRSGSEDPAAMAANAQIRRLVEQAIDELPEPFRLVFVMREIEDCSVEETALSLDLRPETVKTRLHRARRLLRVALQDSLASTLNGAFPFLGPRCDRMTQTVMSRLEPAIAERAAQARGPASP